LALHETPGHEAGPAAANAGKKLAQACLGNNRVLMLPENILQSLGLAGEALG
jgi:hypothetical protein